MATLTEIQNHLAKMSAETERRRVESLHFGDVPCTRNDQRQNSERVLTTLGYACGYLRSKALLSKLTRLHDHKGILHVIYRTALTEHEVLALTNAWHLMFEESIEFIRAGSPDAASVLRMVQHPILTPDEYCTVVRHGGKHVHAIEKYVPTYDWTYDAA